MNQVTRIKTKKKVYIGRKVNEFKLLDILGEGGFGIVYKVEDPNKRMFALNLINFIIICL